MYNNIKSVVMKTLLFYFSDIHLTGHRPENEGTVINAFCEDFKKQLLSNPHDDAYILIGGDIVYSADNPQSYETFEKDILNRLINYGIDRSKIICVPGNHDIQRSWINKNISIYAPVINQQFTEETFNNIINSSQSSIITQKFENYGKFIKNYLGEDKANLVGFPMELNDEWSLYCMNSALTSFGGIDSKDYPLLKEDNKKLNVNTRSLYEWLMRNSKKKILMMHHPIDFLTDWASIEIQKIITTKFDLVLTGHTHLQDIMCNQNGLDSYVWCKAPQLYTDKTDKLGYSIIELHDDKIERIIYREWFESRNRFRPGLDFTEEEDGIVYIENTRDEVKDPILVKFENRFKDSMAVYGDRSLIWIDRFFSLQPFNRSFSFNQKDLYSESEIINERQSIKIMTPAQYGLTSFGWHFLLKIWKESKQFGLYLDSGLIKRGKVERVIESSLTDFQMKKSDVEWFILDNWTANNKDAKQILNYITTEFKDIPIMILCPMLEKSFIEHETVSYSDFKIVNIYMAPMQKKQLRDMVEAYNSHRNIGEGEIVLKRLNDDIQNFNMHRTPLNCISLLEVFSSSFDDNPVNRTSLIEKLLWIIFDNESVPNYRSLPDVKDCEFALGYFCEGMIRNELYYFSNKEFIDIISAFCKKQKITVDVGYLFDILLKNQIICQYDTDTFEFRFTFWVYYFAAMRMTKSKDFANFILEDANYAHYPEVLEFYTGSDRTRNDAASVILKDINKVIENVNNKVGFEDRLNPFKKIKVNLSDEQVSKAINQLDESLKKSKLPNNIKDALDDQNYNPAKPYHQDVNKVWEFYSVNYLQEIIEITSKTLRNSDYIEPELKEQLFDAITTAWYNTIKVVYLIAPVLASEGIAGYDGFRLVLSDSIDDTLDDPKRKLINIIASIPENIITWYKDDIYTSKLTDLIYEKINSEHNLVIKHILIWLVIYEKPDKWDGAVKKYLASVDKESFYYFDTISALKTMYAKGIMTETDLTRTKNLLLLAYTKMIGKDNRLKPEQIGNISKDMLPKRDVLENENG